MSDPSGHSEGVTRARLHLFGRVQLLAGDEEVRIASRNALALIAYLALRSDGAASREHLAHLVWGDRPDAQARHNLRQCLMALRKDLGAISSILIADRDRIALDLGRLEIDAVAFRALAASDEPAALEQAAVLFQGPLCDGLDLEAEAFSEWRRAERGRLEATAARVFRALADHFDEAESGERAIAFAERLVALDPLDEGAQRLLIVLHARHRGRSSAIAVAERGVATIGEGLGAAPSQETVALIESVRQGAIATRAAASPGAVSVAADLTAAPAARRRSGRQTMLAGALSAAVLAAVVIGLALRAPSTATSSSVPRSWNSPAPVRMPAAAELARNGVSAIVVLPFVAEAGDAPVDRVAARVTNDLTNDLARAPALRVISAATARTYAGQTRDTGAVTDELQVAYAVEGSVRVTSGELRINIALVDGGSRLQVWSSRFARQQSELPALQDELARALARELHVGVLQAAPRRAAGRVGSEVTQGWAAMLHIGADGAASQAGEHFSRALEGDAENVPALTGLGAYHASLVAMFLVDQRETHLQQAQEALDRALKLDPDASLAHYFSGILHKTRGEPQRALESFERTLQLNPSFAPAYAQTGHVLSRLGRLEEAIENVQYAMRLSPKDPNLGLWSLFAGEIELERRNDAAALAWLRRAAELDPASPFIRAALAAALAATGDTTGAGAYAAEVRRIAPWLTPARMTERLIGLSQKGSEPKRLLRGLALVFPG